MRNAFVVKLTELARKDERIVLLVGDIGFGVFENFKREFPKRYYNLGIAEQNSVGVVSGLAKEGFFPVFYTIIPFLVYRPFEQIRNDLCINKRNALLVGVGAGLSYGVLGPTHHALEDLGVMSTLPNVRIFTPSSPNVVGKAVEEAIYNGSGPSYLRLGKNGESNLSLDSNPDLKWQPIRLANTRRKIIVLSHGSISKHVESAIHALSLDFSKEITHAVVEQLKPFPTSELDEIIRGSELIITVEEHYEAGGLFEKVLNTANKLKYRGTINNINISEKFITNVGSQENLLEDEGMCPFSLEKRIRRLIQDA
jgi:transketolase